MWFFDSIVDQAQATTSMMTSKSSSVTAVATKTPEITSAEGLIIMDDAPVAQNLESALGLSISDTSVKSTIESSAPTTDLFGLSSEISTVDTSSVGDVIMDVPVENSNSGFWLFMDESSPVAEEVVQDASMEDGILMDAEVSVPSILMDSTPSETSLLFDVADEAVEVASTDTLVSMSEVEEVVEMTEEVRDIEDITPETILAQAVTSLKKISEATDAKKQSALDLEVSLRDQIAEEIEAHKAKIAELEESAENARVLAEQIEEDGKKTKERISLLEKELEAV